MDKQIIPIVFATDENYMPYCGVAISSLVRNTNLRNEYKIYILFDRLSSLSMYRLEQLSTDNVQVKCVCVRKHVSDLQALEHGHITIASAYRLVIANVLPQYEKILYLDSDIVVNDDVAELYNMDVGTNILGAVHGFYKRDKNDFEYNHITKTLGINQNNFFNAGVLIINTIEFKENRVAQKCFSLLSERRDLYYMDQCALNIACEGKVYFFSDRWNYEWLSFDLGNPGFLRRREGLETSVNPAIIHYTGAEKPWNCPEQFLSEYFWEYARQTIFYEEILFSSQLRRTREFLELSNITSKYKNIAIYGASRAGKRYVRKLLSQKLCNIVLWVDKNFADKQGYELLVENVEKVYSTEFDLLLIAIENIVVSNQVKNMLISNNIEGRKIMQIQELQLK